jgi:hypothetical protein
MKSGRPRAAKRLLLSTLAVTAIAMVLPASVAHAFSVSGTGTPGTVQVKTAWGYAAPDFGNRHIYFPQRYAWRAPVSGDQWIRVDYVVYMDTPQGIQVAASAHATRKAPAGSQGVWLPEYWASGLARVYATGTRYMVAVQVTWSTATRNVGQKAIAYDAQGDYACAKVTYYAGAPSCFTDPSGAIVLR